MSKPAKRAAKKRARPSSALPEIPPVPPGIPQRFSQRSQSRRIKALAPSQPERIEPALAALRLREPSPEGTKATTQEVAAEYVEHQHECYLADENPLWVWRAIAIALGAGLQVPAWSLEYLQRAAESIRALTLGSTIPTGNEVAQALELAGKEGGRTPFTALANAQRDVRLAAAVLAIKGAPRAGPRPKKDGVTAFVKTLAEKTNVGEDVVWRAFRLYGKALSELPPGSIVDNLQ